KRIIEVDLPIARISAHARREKSIRHGHISTLHIWWARRPLAACRAVICASLWPDPEDLTTWLGEAQADGAVGPMGPEIRAPRGCKPSEGVLIRPRRFLDEARKQMLKWAERHAGHKGVSEESFGRLVAIQKNSTLLDDPVELRRVLLDFIADFANWDNSTDKAFLEAARALTQAAHESLGGEPGSRPLVVDPFAGGGSIPLEALRVGADAFASDLNPVAVLLNKVVLEYIPKYGQKLADEVRKWGQWVKEQAEKELAEFYPKDSDGATPIAYLWARTVLSEAPGAGKIPVEVPLMRSLWLAKKAGRKRALRWVRLPAGEAGDTQGKVKTETIEVTHVEDGQAVAKSVKRPLLEIFEPANDSEVEGGTVARGSATCPVTGFTTKVDSVRAQLKQRRGGAADARLFCVVTTRANVQGRFYRLPTKADQAAFDAAAAELERRECADGTERSQKGRAAGRRSAAAGAEGAVNRRSLVPDEVISLNELRRISVPIYGMERWGDLFSPRQALALATLARLVREAAALCGQVSSSPAQAEAVRSRGRTGHSRERVVGSAAGSLDSLAGTTDSKESVSHSREWTSDSLAGMTHCKAGTDAVEAETAFSGPPAGFPFADGPVDGFAESVATCLAMALGRQADFTCSLCLWWSGGEKIQHVFGRQAIGMVWDSAECNPWSNSTGCWTGAYEWGAKVCEHGASSPTNPAHVEQASATENPLPDDAAAAFVTDPPYYDAVPYAYLSDFFYVWMRRTLADIHPTILGDASVPKEEEIVVDRPHKLSQSTKNIAFYERELTRAFAEGRRVLAPNGVGTIVFASKTTASWEAVLNAVIDAGFVITCSWPIDTELANRVAAQGQARLGSSVHIACRPRENPDGSVREETGEWREVLGELPERIHAWMPRLAEEGVVGADAIFACLGPALEIFSRYSRVEKASGEVVTLGEYLEQVWAAVSKEALSLLFKDADATSLEPDARLTAMWLWTLGAGPVANGNGRTSSKKDDSESDEDSGGGKTNASGYTLEFDAARKIAQGLGAHLDKLPNVVEVKGDKARLLSVAERTKHLFGKDTEPDQSKPRGRKKTTDQLSLFEELDVAEAAVGGG
ncbi:MAG: DUF1156 domain-containing protein, partial [Planctomycetota bacterium]